MACALSFAKAIHFLSGLGLAPAGHAAPAPFLPEELAQFQKNDKHAAVVIVGLMTSIFVIGLLGRELHPLSVIVQRMRKTKQTSLHLDRLGPFFVGRAAWQLQR